MKYKSASLLILFFIAPGLCFAEGQDGLTEVFFALYTLSFLIQSIVGGILINNSLKKRGINIGLFSCVAISLVVAVGLFWYDRLMFLFPMSLIYLVIMVVIYLVIPRKKD